MAYETPERKRRVAELGRFYDICCEYYDKVGEWLELPETEIDEVERWYLDKIQTLLDKLTDALEYTIMLKPKQKQ
jgi:hypothetical protein